MTGETPLTPDELRYPRRRAGPTRPKRSTATSPPPAPPSGVADARHGATVEAPPGAPDDLVRHRRGADLAAGLGSLADLAFIGARADAAQEVVVLDPLVFGTTVVDQR